MAKSILKIVFFLILFFSFSFIVRGAIVDYKFPCTSFGTQALGYTDCSSADTTASIPNYIRRLYQFAIGISGILAVGMMVAGGILYTVSGGSPDKQNEGKDMIFSALWGLGLLFGAYVILNTINPQLVAIREPQGPQFISNSQTLTEKIWGWDEQKKDSCCVAVDVNGGQARCQTDGWGYDNASKKGCCLKDKIIGECKYSTDQRPVTKTEWGYCYKDSKEECRKAASTDPNVDGISCCLAIEQNGGEAECNDDGWGWDKDHSQTCCIINRFDGVCKYPATSYTTGMDAAEKKAVEKLALNGVRVSSSGNCADPLNPKCTNVGLLPASTIDAVINIKKSCGCDVTITGGAEDGHATHGPDKPVVDLSTNNGLAEYLKNNNSNILKICTTYANRQYAKNCKNSQGQDFYETVEHLHVHFK